jgi:hypothetical protein
MDTIEVSGVLIGTMVFGERLAASPVVLALQLGAAAVAVTGIILLGRSPLAGQPGSDAACQPGRRRSAAGGAHRWERVRATERSLRLK